MKRILLLTLLLLIMPIGIISAQTQIWSSDCENLSGWVFQDIDGDGNNFFNYPDGTYVGFVPGHYLGSLSQSLSPDNATITPAFAIPGVAMNITFSLKVASSSSTDYLETYAVYIQEVGVGSPYDNMLHQETLSNGGPNSFSTINIDIPNSFAGKSVKLIVRHFNTNNEFFFMIDDFSVQYLDTLSTTDSIFENFSFYPNPVKDHLNFNSNTSVTRVQIYNILGQSVLTFNGSNISNNGININSITKGTYLMQVTIDNVTQTYKLIKN